MNYIDINAKIQTILDLMLGLEQRFNFELFEQLDILVDQPKLYSCLTPREHIVIPFLYF